jgi:hypothetical protein
MPTIAERPLNELEGATTADRASVGHTPTAHPDKLRYLEGLRGSIKIRFNLLSRSLSALKKTLR